MGFFELSGGVAGAQLAPWLMMMIGLQINPEWWNWVVFIAVPGLLVAAVIALWMILSAVVEILCAERSQSTDAAQTTDVRDFLRHHCPKAGRSA
jgi:MFS family permease